MLLHIPHMPCVLFLVKVASCTVHLLKRSRGDDTGATTMQRSSGPMPPMARATVGGQNTEAIPITARVQFATARESSRDAAVTRGFIREAAAVT